MTPALALQRVAPVVTTPDFVGFAKSPIVWSVVALLLIVAVLFKAAVQASVTPPSPSGPPASGEVPRAVELKWSTILKYMRSGDENRFFTALQDLVSVYHYNAEVIAEVASAAAGSGLYRNYTFLDSRYRCRLCRFLHMMLDRNYRVLDGRIKTIRMLPFEEVFDDCTSCNSVAPQRSWTSRFLTELIGIVVRVPLAR